MERRLGTDRRSNWRDAIMRLETVEQQNRRLRAFVAAVRQSLREADAGDAEDSVWCEAVSEIELALNDYDDGE